MATREMPKTYNPTAVEQRLYKWWEESGYFIPEIDTNKEPFVISMPPPNVTGVLHLGHAITASVQDLMIRYHHMKGAPTLWLPGEDHASIAAQYVVEKEIPGACLGLDASLSPRHRHAAPSSGHVL